jgi:DNA polymerase-3 subunit epsilon/ATP-dependent DNA helicase DinG
MPEPSQPDYQSTLDQALMGLCAAVAGRTLVLYTSHSGLRSTYHRIRGPLGQLGVTVIGQGLDGSRHNLLEAFRDPDTRTVLLGTRSFWEGIDVPGPALSCLVITRLPFDVPTDPVFAARSETFDSPFFEYAVPQAVLRFRQGFGRLIRSGDDRGVVVVLDQRIRSKSYGRLFVDALPPVSRRIGPLHELAEVARRFVEAAEPLAGDPLAAPGGEPHVPRGGQAHD